MLFGLRGRRRLDAEPALRNDLRVIVDVMSLGGVERRIEARLEPLDKAMWRWGRRAQRRAVKTSTILERPELGARASTTAAESRLEPAAGNGQN